jgi:simple sugar transport system permease protein
MSGPTDSSGFFDLALWLAFAAQVLRITVPYAMAALGGALSERSGVVNIALEGKLLLGAFWAAVGAYHGNQLLGPWAAVPLGALFGVAGGVALAALHALVVIRFRADQIVSGVALNILALGLTRYLLSVLFGSTANSPPTPGFEGSLLANPLLWAICALCVAVHVMLFRTAFGLRVRAVGEHPEAADALGVSVVKVRWLAMLAAGALAGLGGAWMALENRGFVGGMSGGRGYIALAAVIMGKWRPGLAAVACLIFGIADAVQLNLQASQVGVPNELAHLLPFAICMIAVTGFMGRSRPPAAVGKPWEPD